MIVIAKIDASKPTGRRIVRELENKKCVELQFENPELSGQWVDFKDMIEDGFDDLSAHYGVDMRALSKIYPNLQKEWAIK
jgi:hypothetical protein